MASDDQDAAPAAVPCSACRGTGRVISNLGEKRDEIVCPWCEGRGERLREHDAQAALRGEEAPAGPPPNEPPDLVA